MKSFFIRTASALVFLAVMAAALLWRIEAYAVVFSFVAVVCAWEYLRMSLGQKVTVSKVVSIAATVALFLSFAGVAGGCFGVCETMLCLGFIAVLMFCVSLFSEKDMHEVPHLFFPLVYIGVPLCMMTLMVGNADGSFNALGVLMTFCIIWVGDVFAYIFGTLFGQGEKSAKLWPEVSPKKSWVGVYAGLLGAVLCGVAFELLFFDVDFQWRHTLIRAAVSCVVYAAAVCGDLFESRLKRTYGCKDSGTIMPGHGGLLDSFAAAFFAMTVDAVFSGIV